MTKNVLLVTGASKGIGFEVVLAGLKAGYTVVGTSRTPERLETAVQEEMKGQPYDFKGLSMAFDEMSIQQAIKEVIDTYGRIDVLVNNAGYALLGAIEEMTMSDIRQNFDINFFGLLGVTQAVLPYMRQARAGRIINLASISGTVTGPTQGVYSATKAAVIMLSEALSSEVAPFNIQVTAICPGGVRTDFLDSNSLKKPTTVIEDYEVVRQTMSGFDRLNGNQSGDPKLVAKAIIEVSQLDQAPKRLYLGTGALGALQSHLDNLTNEVNAFINLSQSTDYK